MRKTPFLVLLSVVALMGSGASCQCSGEGASGSGASAQGTGTAAATPGMKESSFKLGNGLQVDLVEGPCGESAAIAVLFNVGIDHDPPGRSGMTRLLGRVLAASAGGRSPDAAASAGGRSPTVETGTDYTVYSVSVPGPMAMGAAGATGTTGATATGAAGATGTAGATATATGAAGATATAGTAGATGDGLLAEIEGVAAWMAKAAPTEEVFGRERAKMVEELGKLAGIDAAGTATRLAEEGVLPTRGNGKRLGIAKEVEAITLAELVTFWQERFKPGNARLTVAGRFDAEKVKARIEAAFGPLPAGTPGEVREPGTATVKGTLVMGNAPSAVAIAVPAPALSDPLYAAFLVQAARLLAKPAEARTWDVAYDPIRRPELLLITGPVGPTEQPEPSAGRMRTEVAAVLAKPLSAEDVKAARERFAWLLDSKLTDPGLCAKDVKGFAMARVRRAQLGVDVGPIGQALDGLTAKQLEDAAKGFDSKQTAAVIAGGALP